MDMADEYELREILGQDSWLDDYDDGGGRPFTGGLALTGKEAAELRAITASLVARQPWAEGLHKSAKLLKERLGPQPKSRPPLVLTIRMASALRETAYSLNRAMLGSRLSYDERGRFLELAAKAGCRPEPPITSQVEEGVFQVAGAALEGFDNVARWWKKNF